LNKLNLASGQRPIVGDGERSTGVLGSAIRRLGIWELVSRSEMIFQTARYCESDRYTAAINLAQPANLICRGTSAPPLVQQGTTVLSGGYCLSRGRKYRSTGLAGLAVPPKNSIWTYQRYEQRISDRGSRASSASSGAGA
jgi:hypothetical protein